MRITTVAFFLLSGCIVQGVYDDTPKQNQTEAVAIVADMLQAEYAINLEDIPIKVYWSELKCTENGYTNTAVIVPGIGCFAGLTKSCSEIYVAWRGSFADSAFAHELSHCYHSVYGDDYDGHHKDFQWWAFVEMKIRPALTIY